MPQGARLDAPGTLHHVIIRGIEKENIVRDDKDRQEFLHRMGELAQGTGTSIYAFALMTNHAHILLKSGEQGLSTFMRRLLSGYAQYIQSPSSASRPSLSKQIQINHLSRRSILRKTRSLHPSQSTPSRSRQYI